jgi:hypothetical protein
MSCCGGSTIYPPFPMLPTLKSPTTENTAFVSAASNMIATPIAT